MCGLDFHNITHNWVLVLFLFIVHQHAYLPILGNNFFLSHPMKSSKPHILPPTLPVYEFHAEKTTNHFEFIILLISLISLIEHG